MTTLIKNHTVLKASPILGTGFSYYQYRMTIGENGLYTVHMSVRELNGTCGEQFLYEGDSLMVANRVFTRYSV
jgi:hypothetical protein